MYERFFSGELTSGNYLVQNTPQGRSFLKGANRLLLHRLIHAQYRVDRQAPGGVSLL